MAEEPALQPEFAIVDPHFHLRDQRAPEAPGERYRAADFQSEIARSGHRVVASVFVECGIMYDAKAPADERSLGETAYVGALAREAASGIVARVDLTLGSRSEDLLEKHAQAAQGRLRGVRNSIAHAASGPFAGLSNDPALLRDPALREGVRLLGRKGLAFESWLFHPQIGELTALARACPDTSIVLEHLGCPLGLGDYAGDMGRVFSEWRRALAELAKCPNVHAKIGGLGPFWEPAPKDIPVTSGRLASEWKPWIETAIELFGCERCMFESNWPANRGVSSYGQIWNAFKLVTLSSSNDERAALFARTARSVYRIEG
ncbi:amidohydrolase family protein [Novosphingobium profundi]|uniref:amidohydrolase family protein n=1 Tax=Novosphingobium profundi TaxID=1774954 RepID=UPI001BDA743B|nr:amidohydrolase family protein [Novosphingobium profundi]MBT0671009.1 amidohydrolase family protein [Novosphingobium profundi]